MPIIKEFREFFLRSARVNSGSKRDQEVGFPTTYLVDGKEVFNRLLKGHYPSEATLTKLLESLTFKLNPEDKATIALQGLVTIASDANVRSRTDESATVGALVAHQMIEVVSAINGGTDTIIDTTTVAGITIARYNRVVGGKSRMIYLLSVPVTASTEKYYLLSNDLTIVNNVNDNLLQTIKTYPLVANTMSGNGDKLTISSSIYFKGSPNATLVQLSIGSTTMINFPYQSNTDYEVFLNVEINRISVISSFYKFSIVISTILGSNLVVQFTGTTNEDYASNLGIILHAQCANTFTTNQLSCKQFLIEYFKK